MRGVENVVRQCGKFEFNALINYWEPVQILGKEKRKRKEKREEKRARESARGRKKRCKRLKEKGKRSGRKRKGKEDSLRKVGRTHARTDTQVILLHYSIGQTNSSRKG